MGSNGSNEFRVVINYIIIPSRLLHVFKTIGWSRNAINFWTIQWRFAFCIHIKAYDTYLHIIYLHISRVCRKHTNISLYIYKIFDIFLTEENKNSHSPRFFDFSIRFRTCFCRRDFFSTSRLLAHWLINRCVGKIHLTFSTIAPLISLFFF